MTRTAQRESFNADILITALEEGVKDWASVTDYRAYVSGVIEDMNLGPQRHGGDNVTARLLEYGDETSPISESYVTPAVIAKAFGLLRKQQVPGLHENYRTRYLAAWLEKDAGELDAWDSSNILQIALWEEVRYS